MSKLKNWNNEIVGKTLFIFDNKFQQFVIPGLTKPAPYLIRGNPVLNILVPCFRRDDAWIPAFAGMTVFVGINVAYTKEF